MEGEGEMMCPNFNSISSTPFGAAEIIKDIAVSDIFDETYDEQVK